MSQSVSRKNLLFFALVLLVLAGILRFYHLGFKSLTVDEIATKTAAARGVGAAVRFAALDVTPPFHYLVAVAVNGLGDSEFMLRLPPAVLGTFSVPLFFWLMLRSGQGKHAAVIASLILALSVFHVGFSQDARMYSYVVFFTILSTLALVILAVGVVEFRSRRHLVCWGVVFVCSSVLNCYTSYFSFLLLASQLLFLLLAGSLWLLKHNRERGVVAIRLWLATAVIIVIAYLPWLPMVGRLASEQASGQGRSLAASVKVISSLLWEMGGRNTWWTWLFGILAVVGLWSLRRSSLGFYSLILFAIPVGALVGFQTRHFVAARYFAFLVPQYFLLVACGAERVTEVLWLRIPTLRSQSASGQARLRSAGSVLVGLILALGSAPALHKYYGAHIQNWREAARVLARDGKPNDLVFCGVNMSGESLRYYLSRLDAADRFRYVERCRKRDCFEQAFFRAGRGWLVTSHAGFVRERYPDLWHAIQERMLVHARIPALEDYGEIWIYRLDGPLPP